MVTNYQHQLAEELQQAWLELREEIILIENAQVKDKLLFQVDKCLDWTLLFYLAPMQDALEAIVNLAMLNCGDSHLFGKIHQVKCLLSELSFTFTLQGENKT